MKLTKSDKQAFVRAVMDDIPSVDYDKELQTLVTQYELSIMHPDVIAAINNPNVQSYIKKNNRMYVRRMRDPMTYHAINVSDLPVELQKQIDALIEADERQSVSRYEIENKLTAAIGACTTLKVAKERLPEFVKYLPQERDSTGVTHLPVIANLVADLTCLGWPKEATSSV